MKYYLSQSALQSFEKCPRKYYYYYILRYKGEMPFIAPMDFGITVHNLIERAYDIYKADRKEILGNMILDKASEMEDEVYQARMIKLKKPLAKIVDTIDVSETELYVSDKLFDVSELSLETINAIINIQKRRGKDGELEGVWFGGFIDAVGIMNGKKIAIDWKTGKFSRMWVKKYERQLQLYTNLLRLNGEYINQAKIIYVEHDFEHNVDSKPSTCENEYSKMKDAFRDILALGDFIENFEMIKDPIECNGCSYDFICNA